MLDTDWYKITMGQVVHFFFPKVEVKYKFILRSDVKFPDGFDKKLQAEIYHLATLKLSPSEYDWLSKNKTMYNYYLQWFSTYHFDPAEVKISFENNKLGITIEGLWERTIYWEVPLLAIISELYFQETQLDKEFVRNSIVSKIIQLKEIPYIEFGTRRRFSYDVHDKFLQEVFSTLATFPSGLIGTSNPHFAMRHGFNVIGTYAHEAIMAMQALYGCKEADSSWLDYWKVLYGKELNVALSDTLTTNYFLKSIADITFQMLDGIRQDSGDPIHIATLILDKWCELGIDPKTKSIVFSDNLNPDKARSIWNIFKRTTNPIFGIGTNLTNDFGVKPLNMVIKLVEANGCQVIKLSDDTCKHTGDPELIKYTKDDLGISDDDFEMKDPVDAMA